MNRLLALLFALAVCVSPALAGSGEVRVFGVVNNGGSPPTYTLTVDSSTGMTVNDHLCARRSTTATGVYKITTITSGVSITVTDSLTEHHGSAYGVPVVGVGSWATPTSALGLTLPPYGAQAWDAAFRRNMYLISVSSSAGNHNLLSSTHQDSTAAAATRGDLISAQGASPAWSRLALGASGRFLRSDGTDPGWSTIGTSDLPTIPLTGGGTGATSASDARTALGVVPGTDVQQYSSLLAAIAAASPTKGHLIVGNGSTWVVRSVGTNGQVLTADNAQSDGLTWSSAGGGGGTHQLLSATHPDTTSATVVRGDLITGQSGPTWNRLAIGASGRYLRSDGTDASWGVLSMDDASSGTLAVARGGTGGTDAATARTNLSAQASDSDLTAIAALTHTSGYLLRSNGSAWVSGAPSFSDALLAVTDDSDATKVAVFQASGINTATTRTYTLPNASGTLALTSDITSTGDFLDTVFQIKDQADATKIMAFQASGITTGTTRTLTIPDASGTIQLTDPQLTDVAAVTPSANQFLGGDGANLVMRSASQVKTSLAIDHGADVTGLGDDDHTQYALLAGRSGGQTLYGSTASSESINIRSTSHGTKGTVGIGALGGTLLLVDESTPRIRTNVTSSSSSAILAAIRHEARTPADGAGSAGFGHATDVYLNNSATTVVQAGRQSFAWSDATSTSEDASLSFSLMRAGALTEALAVNSLGQITTGDWQATAIGVTKGGTGATDAAGARAALDVQQLDAQLTDVAAVSATADQFLGGNGSNLVMRTASQVRTSLSIGTLTVEDNTAGSGAPNQLASSESSNVLTNQGATAENYEELPAAAAGLHFVFVCKDVDGLRVTSVGDDTIRIGAYVTGAASYVSTAKIGNTLELLGVSSTEYVAIDWSGYWRIAGAAYACSPGDVIVLSNNATGVARTSTGDLQTFSLPAGQLQDNGDAVEVVWLIGSTGADALMSGTFGSKQKIVVNATGNTAYLIIRYTRTGATTQDVALSLVNDGGQLAQVDTASETLSGASNIKGEVTTYTSGTVTGELMTVTFHKAGP